MKNINTPSELPQEGMLLSNSLQTGRRPRFLPVVMLAGLLVAGTGIVVAQNGTSSLPQPPAIAAPQGGAPASKNGMPAPPAPDANGPRGGRPLPGGPEDGPGRGPGMGPRRGPLDGPGGPGPEAGRPTPPDADTQEGAAHALEHAYRAVGETGSVDNDAKDMANTARTLYNRAYEAFNAKNYSRAFVLADASARLSRTTRALSEADSDGPKLASVPGLTPPPAVAPKNDADRAAHELNRNYDEANRAAQFNNAASNRYRSLSEESYKAALAAYNSKKYGEAARKARLGAEQGRAAREYAETLALN